MSSSSCIWLWYELTDRAFALGFRLLSWVTSTSQLEKVGTNKLTSAWAALRYKQSIALQFWAGPDTSEELAPAKDGSSWAVWM